MRELIIILSFSGVALWLLLAKRYPFVRPFVIFPVMWMASAGAMRVAYFAFDHYELRYVLNDWSNANTLFALFFFVGLAVLVLTKGEGLWK